MGFQLQNTGGWLVAPTGLTQAEIDRVYGNDFCQLSFGVWLERAQIFPDVPTEQVITSSEIDGLRYDAARYGLRAALELVLQRHLLPADYTAALQAVPTANN